MAPRPKATPRKPKQAASAGNPQPPAANKPLSFALPILLAFANIALVAVLSVASQLNLSPVYGSIPSSLYHQRLITFTCLIAFMTTKSLRGSRPQDLHKYIPVLIYWMPPLQFVLFTFSTRLGPKLGPLLTEACTFVPVLFLAMYRAGELIERVALRFRDRHPRLVEMIPAVSSYFAFSTTEKLVQNIIPHYIGTSNFLTRSGLESLIASVYAALSPSKLVLLAIPAMLHTSRVNPHCPQEANTEQLSWALENHNFSLVARHESVTGYISVLVGHNEGFRIMRCDHSILGGNWLVTPDRQARGQTIEEPVFNVFTMLESVRLVKTADERPQTEKKALVIGLGIGTTPSSFIANGINTTIVELDPVVHYYASKYFGLPSNHTAAIQDAAVFVNKASKAHPGSYDLVVHDVFTGGAEPSALFTIEFLQGLRTLMTDAGVVAINYAGDVSLPATQLVLNTIHIVFPACRIFRDSPPKFKLRESGENEPDFINMVIYCVKAPNTEILFREPDETDFRGSLSRRQFLYPKPHYEIRFGVNRREILGQKSFLRKDNTFELDKYHDESAISHWGVMRTVLPDAVWELW